MRISDWSSDVCSSDLPADQQAVLTEKAKEIMTGWAFPFARHVRNLVDGIGRDCREVSLAENARLAAGANAIGVPEAEIEALLDSDDELRSEEHTSELQSLMRISYAVFCLKKKKQNHKQHTQ